LKSGGRQQGRLGQEGTLSFPTCWGRKGEELWGSSEKGMGFNTRGKRKKVWEVVVGKSKRPDAWVLQVLQRGTG